jgi:anti-anti-sigma regulatory factor
MAGTLVSITGPSLKRIGGRACVATAPARFRDDAASRYAALVESALQDGCLELVLDLTAVVDLDSAGAVALCEIEIALKEADVEVAVAAASQLVLSTLRSAQLDVVWRVAPDVPRALAELLAPPVGRQQP